MLCVGFTRVFERAGWERRDVYKMRAESNPPMGCGGVLPLKFTHCTEVGSDGLWGPVMLDKRLLKCYGGKFLVLAHSS